MDDSQDLINTKTAADIIGVSPQTLRTWTNLGRVPIAIRTMGGAERGGQARYRRADIIALRDSLAVTPSA